MPKQLQSIYEYLSSYREEDINDVINNLTDKDKSLIRDRYGDDLHNPRITGNFDSDKSHQFYGSLVPKIKRLLEKLSNDKTSELVSCVSVKENEEKSILDTKEEKDEINYTQSFEVEIDQNDVILSLLQLLKSERSTDEICTTLDINEQQLYKKLLLLKNSGVTYLRKYYSDASIKYKSVVSPSGIKKAKMVVHDRDIITNVNEENIKVLLISDLHIGNEKQRIDLINRAFNYCIKNGIHVILCGGDFIDGTFTKGKQLITDPYKQLIYFIKNYPHDKSIVTFGVGGDHDVSALGECGVDIIELCNNYRHDIVIGGYNNAMVNLKSDCIQLFHHTPGGTLLKKRTPIIAHGHSHQFSAEVRDNVLNINIPALSDIMQLMPSVLELNLYFNYGYINNAVVKQIYFGNHDIVLNELCYDLCRNKINDIDDIRNVEVFCEKKIDTDAKIEFEEEKTLTKVMRPLSQIEKFNKRWGK